MKLWIEPDERYPIYNWTTEPRLTRRVVDLTEEEFKKVEAAYELFEQAQDLFEQKFKAAK